MRYKLYTVKNAIDKSYCWEFFLDEGVCPKNYIRQNFAYLDLDLRTLKEEEFPMGEFHASDLGHINAIFYNREMILRYDDEDSVHYPEDLIWERDISTLIYNARLLERLKIKDELKKLMDKYI